MSPFSFRFQLLLRAAPEITPVLLRAKGPAFQGKRGLNDTTHRTANAAAGESDRSAFFGRTYPHGRQQVSWLALHHRPRLLAFAMAYAACSSLTVTGSLGIGTRFPIISAPEGGALSVSIYFTIVAIIVPRPAVCQAPGGRAAAGSGGVHAGLYRFPRGPQCRMEGRRIRERS